MAGQLITIKMSRGDSSSPWGFRLQGGKDWMLPLSVSKLYLSVNPGSLADQAGLRIGDIIVKINGQNADSMLHKEAQDAILHAGNNLDITIMKGGTTTWKPTVTPIFSVSGSASRPVSGVFDPPLVTKTSLAHNHSPAPHVGSSHNKAPAPFSSPAVPSSPASSHQLVNKQYNSPINLYSMQNIKQVLEAHSDILAPGVKRINFMKPDAPVNTHSAVYQAILEEEQAKSQGTASSASDHRGGELPPEKQYHEVLRQTSTSPSFPSSAFQRLRHAFDGNEQQPQGAPTTTNLHSPPQPLSPTTNQPTMQPTMQSILQPKMQPTTVVTKHVKAPTTLNRPSSEQGQHPTSSTNVCYECGRMIIGVFCRINDRNFHPECFKCSQCGNPLSFSVPKHPFGRRV